MFIVQYNSYLIKSLFSTFYILLTTYHTIHFVFSNHLEAYINITLNVFSAIKRADSSASKRKVSSISASDTSDHEVQEGSSPLPEESPNVFAEEKDVYESHLFDLPDDEEHLEYNMPWLGVMTKVLASFNYHCTHQNFCHPQCYRRQMRAAKRIMEATRHVRTTTYYLDHVYNYLQCLSVLPHSVCPYSACLCVSPIFRGRRSASPSFRLYLADEGCYFEADTSARPSACLGTGRRQTGHSLT